MSFTKNLLNKAPVPYVRRDGRPSLWGDGGSGSRSSQLAAMGGVGTLFGIVNALSVGTASIDWKLWRKAASGKEEDRTEVTIHPALTVLNKPNNFFTRQELFESSQQHVDLTGESWWVLGYEERFRALGPTEIWPVRPDRMAPVKHATEFISGYVYSSPDGDKVPLRPEEVVFIRMSNPDDIYRGLGPVQALARTIDSLRYSEEWNRNFFLNSAEPGGIIEVPERLSDDEFNEMRTRWNEQHKGVANAHRVAILEHGTWKDRKFTMRDMQFAELGKLGSDRIREAFRVHKSVLGQSDDVNRANAVVAREDKAELIVERLDRFKGALNNDFLPLFGKAEAKGLEFDYENAVPENAEERDRERDSKASAWAALVSAGAHPDDASAAVGLPIMRTVERPQPREEQMA
jgi:HK97 family phage portal protein